MEGFQTSKSSGGLGVRHSCRKKSGSKKLIGEGGGLVAITKIQADRVNTIDVNHDKVISECRLAIGTWITDSVTQLNVKAGFF